MSRLDHRIPPPVLMMLAGGCMGVLARLAGPWPVSWSLRATAAGALGLAGLACLVAGFRAFRRARTTINPLDIDAAAALVTTGVYRYTRNPMYLGFALLLLAWSFWLASPWTLLGPVFFCLFIHRFQIVPEERALHARFGPGYAHYRRTVRRWL